MEEKKVAVVIDDARIEQLIVMRELEAKGYTVFLAEDGQVAINNLENYGKVDLFVIDFNMPNKDGPITILELRQHEKYKTVQIVGRSSSPDLMREKATELLERQKLNTENLRYVLKPGRVNPENTFQQCSSDSKHLASELRKLTEKRLQNTEFIDENKTEEADVAKSNPEKSPVVSHSPIRKQSE